MRRWLPLAVLALLGLAHSAWAQTTTFPGSVCGSSFSVSGGTNVSIPSSGGNAENCLANVSKVTGLWYFTSTSSSFGWTNSVGLANVGLPTNGYSSGGGQAIGDGANAVGLKINQDGGAQNYARYIAAGVSGTFVTGTITPISGATMGIAVNLNSPPNPYPNQFWITPDITGTTGCGGGPLWNGDVNSAPVARGGCGGPGTGLLAPGTGLTTTLDLPPVFPAITGQNFGGQETVTSFNFSDNATLDALLGGAGYQAWNVSGGQTRNGSSPTFNVANAPGWQSSHAYVAGDRVVTGPGWSSGSYVWGQPLYLWAVTGSGGTSASFGNGPQDCPSPAGYGSGFSGSTPSQWSGHTTASDGSGSLVWTCLTPVNYVTMTGLLLDDEPWQSGHTYFYKQFVTSNGHSFWNLSGHTSTPATCVSGSTAPVPGGSSDGNCTWEDLGAVIYSSGAPYYVHSTVPVTNSGVYVINLTGVNTINVWYGGKENPMYQSGVNENSPIFLNNHSSGGEGFDNGAYCADGLTAGPGGNAAGSCGFYPFYNLTVAPGDAAMDTIAAVGGTPLTGPDSAKGVMLYSNLGYNTGGNEALAVNDAQSVISRFQVKGENDTATSGESAWADISGHYEGEATGFGFIYQNMIFQSPGTATVVCGACAIENSVVLFTGTTAPLFGAAIYMRFGGDMINDIVLGPGSSACTNCVGRAVQKDGYNSQIYFQNTYIAGFAAPYAYLPEYAVPLGANNATDAPSSFTGGSPCFTGQYGTGCGTQLLGTGGTCQGGSCQGLLPSDLFVSTSTPDYHLSSTSALIGSGSDSFGLSPATDLLGNARPTSGRYDIGPTQFQGSPPPLSIVSVNLSASTFVPGMSSTVGNLTTIPNTGSFSGTDTIQTSGVSNIGSNSGTTCPNNGSNFAISGSSPSYSLTTTGPAAGSYTVCVSSDQPGASNTPAIQAFDLTGSSTPPAPVITSPTSATGTAGVSFSYQITATNSPTSFNATGLPSPLVVNTSTGFITGTPSGPSTTDIPISATNAGGTGSASLHLVLSNALTTTGGGLRLLNRW